MKLFKNESYKEIKEELKNIKDGDYLKFVGYNFKEDIFELPCFRSSKYVEDVRIEFEKCSVNHTLYLPFKFKEIVYNDCEIRNFEANNNHHQTIQINNILFFNCEINKLILKGLLLDFLLLKDIKEKQINKLIIQGCELRNNFCIDIKNITIRKIDFTNSIFEEKVKVKIKNCIIEDANFYNVKFKDLADFYKSQFEEVSFERTDFEDIAIFSECIFREDTSFKYTKFFKKAIFKDTIFKKTLDLRNTIFGDKADFLGVSSKQKEIKDIKVRNRETARIIKNLFDESGNIIEANIFYKLEMDKRREELNQNGSFRDKIVFNFHKYSANHSQDWDLALFWLIYFTFLMTLKDDIKILIPILIFSIPFLFALFYNRVLLYVGLIVSFIFCFEATDKYNLNSFFITYASVLKIDINGINVLYKILIGYLTYQFIISIRQNTRRK